MARDGVNLLTSQLEILAKRVDALAQRPALTREQLEEALAGLGQRSGIEDGASRLGSPNVSR
jgi:hypothetical protein